MLSFLSPRSCGKQTSEGCRVVTFAESDPFAVEDFRTRMFAMNVLPSSWSRSAEHKHPISSRISICAISSRRPAGEGNESLTFGRLPTIASLLILFTYDERQTGKVERCASRYCLICFWHRVRNELWRSFGAGRDVHHAAVPIAR